MLRTYQIDGKEVDSIDLKSLVISKGIKVSNEVYKKFSSTNRIYPDPLTCNCFILPDKTVVQMTDIALHLNYLKSAMSLQNLKQMKYFFQMNTPFKLKVSGSGKPVLMHGDSVVTEVEFPPESHFYEQVTSSGMPYLNNAVLQGVDTLSFQCLWACDYARAGYPCQFCYSGGMFEQLEKKGKPMPPVPSPRDAAEIADYAVNREKVAKILQLTGGSTMDTRAECGLIRDYLKEIDSVAGLKNLSGEVLIYTTPPADPSEIDKVFAAGADRVACSLEVWDEKLAQIITPGKWKFTTRKRHLDCQKYISREYGPNKACSSFVVGLEPAKSFLEGAEYLASEGIVPIASVWIPFGRPVMGKMQAPGLDYYRAVKEGLAEIYIKYGIEPPGDTGFNVCVCRDTWNHRSEVSSNATGEGCCESKSMAES
jgi:hypothetical protein